MTDLEEKRNEELIREREEYEHAYFSQIIDGMMESDALDRLISERLNYIDDNFDFEPSPEYLRLEQIYFAEMEAKFINDEDKDHMEDYDYPEGPDENIEGMIYPREHVYDFADIDFPDFEQEESYQIPEYTEDQYHEIKSYDDIINNQIENFNPDHYYGEVFEDEDEAYIQKLIEDYEEEDNQFFDSLVIEAIQEEHYFEKAIDEILFDRLEEQYSPEFFDYDEEPHWYSEYDYDDCVSEEDKALTDPFDSFDEIDYPDIGEPKFEYEHSAEIECMMATEEDFERYMRNSAKSSDENHHLIKKQEELEAKFKDYLTSDDRLDNLIKEKLKEKKFNQ